MKRIAIGAFVFMLAAVLLVGCGISEQEKRNVLSKRSFTDSM